MLSVKSRHASGRDLAVWPSTWKKGMVVNEWKLESNILNVASAVEVHVTRV